MNKLLLNKSYYHLISKALFRNHPSQSRTSFGVELEISIIRKSVEIADETFTHILSYIKPGVSELELAAEMEHHMRRLGARGASFETIVASGKRSSLPHGVASEKKLEMGDTVTLDFGAVFNNY